MEKYYQECSENLQKYIEKEIETIFPKSRMPDWVVPEKFYEFIREKFAQRLLTGSMDIEPFEDEFHVFLNGSYPSETLDLPKEIRGEIMRRRVQNRLDSKKEWSSEKQEAFSQLISKICSG